MDFGLCTDKKMDKQITIRFLAEVNKQSINTLIAVVESKLNEGIDNFKILISSPGGAVLYGISAYNFLKGIPATIETYNFGTVDSIATVIYCAGSKRFCVPNARFLIHSVAWGSPAGSTRFEEKQLKEQVKSLKIDRENIAKIIAENCEKTQKEIEDTMLQGMTFNSDQAKDFGLVDEIKETILNKGEKIIGIG